jgi:ribonuclease T2
MLLFDRWLLAFHPLRRQINPMKMKRSILAILLSFLFITPLAARHRGSYGGAPNANVGDFDFFLLSLSIAPSFCALSPANQAKDECASLTEAAFQQTPLTVHGLWPNRVGVSGNRQPQDCDGPPFEPPSGQVQTELQRYMPGGPGLARYEWRKHGVCSGLSPQTYFAAVATLAQHANEKIGTVMREQNMLGHPVRIADLLAAVGAGDAALASAIVVNCRTPRGGGPAMIEEIRVVLSKDLAPMPASGAGMRQNSGCPQGQGLVPDVAK